MLDSIYHMTMMTLKLLKNHIFGVKKILQLLRKVNMDVITKCYKNL